jgi:hypothetical protein
LEPKKTAQFWCYNVAALLADVYPMATEQDYHIVTFNTGQAFLPWRWELRRRSSPMGVVVGRSGYHSKAAAEYEGKQALERFLRSLAKEERQRK